MNDQFFRDDDRSRQGATEDDAIRDAVIWQDKTTYSLGLPQVYARFVEAGLDRSLRTLQRYCEQGHLRAAKYPTETGAVWYVDPDSVETKIEEIRQVQETLRRQAAPGPVTAMPTPNDSSRHDAVRRPVSSHEVADDTNDNPLLLNDDDLRRQNDDAARRLDAPGASTDASDKRHATTTNDERYVSVPVVMLDAVTAQLAAKDEQIRRRDAQLERLVETHDKDRQLLGAALAVIHKGDFAFSLEEGRTPDAAPEPAIEIRPELHRNGGNPQPPRPDASV